jgi:hypothetical protein
MPSSATAGPLQASNNAAIRNELLTDRLLAEKEELLF